VTYEVLKKKGRATLEQNKSKGITREVHEAVRRGGGEGTGADLGRKGSAAG